MVILYKYLSLSENRINWLIDIIEKDHIFLSDGKEFNDPFDVSISEKDEKIKKQNKFKILCLTSSYRNRLMWAHYADSHKGVCLTLELDEELVYPVFYTNKRIYNNTNLNMLVRHGNLKRSVIRKLSKEYDMEPRKKLGFVKDSTWTYENEYRVVCYGKERDILENRDYLKVHVRNVYLGACISEHDEKIIRNICKKKKVSVKKISFNKDSYSIKVN